MKKLMSLFVIVSILTSTSLFAQVKFQYASFDYAKSHALKTQKPFFVYFASNECDVCWEMNRSTFNDLDLSTAVNGTINAYKVDIKSKAGDLWAMKFAIYKAPAFIFFDKDGNMTQRVEHSLAANELKNLAADPSSYHEMKGEFAALTDNSMTSGTTEATTAEYSETVTTTDDSALTSAETVWSSNETVSGSVPENVYETASENIPETVTSNTSGIVTESISETIIESTPTTVPESETTFGVYAVQTGIFTNENYAERMAKDLANNYNYSINVRTEIIDGKTFHRVLLGDFADESSAKSVYQILKNDGRKAFVKTK